MEKIQEIDLKNTFEVYEGLNVVCSENFSDYLKPNSTYVDKTGLIYHLIFIPGHILFSCPRRFGKTLNLSMIKCFFQLKKNEKSHKYLKKKFEELKIGSSVDLHEITTVLLEFQKNSQPENPHEKIKCIFYSIKKIINDVEKYNKMEKKMTDNHTLNNQKNRNNQSILYLSLMETIKDQISVWKNSKETNDQTNYMTIIKKFGIVERYFGKYPVLSVSFKNVIGDLNQVIIQLKNEIKNVFNENLGILKSLLIAKELETSWAEKMSISAKIKKFILYLDGNITNSELTDSLKFLSQLLYENFGKKVYIIIDEYDRAVNKLFEEKLLTSTNYDKNIILDQIRSVSALLSGIIAPCAKEGVDSKYIEKIILSGIYNTLLKESGSGVNNIDEYGVVDIQYCEYFGFTESEMTNKIFPQVFKNYKQNEQKILRRFKKWYNGQLVGNRYVFTPSSVIKYIRDLKLSYISLPKQYWSNTGVSAIIKNINKLSLNDDLSEKMLNLSLGKTISLSFNRDITLFSFFSNESIKENLKNESIVTYLLVRSGYITKIECNQNFFKIPAYEIQKSFVEKVTDCWIRNKYRKTQKIFKDFKKLFENSKKFEKFLNEQVLDNLIGTDLTESDFKSTIFGISLLSSTKFGNFHHIKSEVRTNKNKIIDTIFFPVKSESNVVVLHEYKKAKKASKKEELLEDALWQIYTNMYMNLPIELRKKKENNFWEIIKIRAIVFYFENNKWEVEIIENSHSFEEAEKLIKLFSEDGSGKKFLSNSRILLGKEKKKEKKNQRSNFLLKVLKLKNKTDPKLTEISKYLEKNLSFFVNNVEKNVCKNQNSRSEISKKKIYNNSKKNLQKRDDFENKEDSIFLPNKKFKLQNFISNPDMINSTSNGKQN